MPDRAAMATGRGREERMGWRAGLVVARAIAAMGPAPGPALANPGGTLRISHRDNPPSASIHEEATISTVEPFMGVFNNLVPSDHPLRPPGHLPAATREGFCAAPQQHLQQLALRGRMAR